MANIVMTLVWGAVSLFGIFVSHQAIIGSTSSAVGIALALAFTGSDRLRRRQVGADGFVPSQAQRAVGGSCDPAL
jgi:amino acid transporter